MKWLVMQQFSELNPSMAIDYIIKLSWHIEQIWDVPAERDDAIDQLKLYLASWGAHKNPALFRLSRFTEKLAREMSLKHFLGIMVPIEREFSRGIRDDDFLVREGDAPLAKARQTIQLMIILDNIRSAFNVGSIFRTAECIGASKIHLCGYTSTPEDPKTAKTAMGCDKLVPWQWHQHTEDIIQTLKGYGTKVIAIETAVNSPSVHSFSFPSPCALLFGNERHGISQPLLALSDAIVHIPVFGQKNSLNIGTAMGVCSYEIRRQWGIPVP